MRNKFLSYIKKEKEETEILLRSIPSTVVSLFVVSVICMNLLANKTIHQSYYLALDGGFLISWLSFMCMDIITKYFGPKASNKIAIFASIINLVTCIIFYIASIIPSNAGDYTELNLILGGTWFILLGSTIAFLVSVFINNFLNWSIGKMFVKNPDGKLAYATQTYVSTFIGQLLDNLIFSIIVFVIFAPIFWNGFHWTILQCITCAITGASLELFMEIIFSPIGYKTIQKWKKQKIGTEYLEYIKEKKMNILITGTSQGIGKAIAKIFLEKGHKVIGIDRQEKSIDDENYTHYVCDIRDYDKLPKLNNINILINNAGTQNEDDININLKALIHITEKYGLHKEIHSILNIGSASAHTGSEFPEYCASKAGIFSIYKKNVALRVAKYGATCNSLDPGGVITPLNDCVMNEPLLWQQIMDETPLKRWASAREIAQWAYFLTITNRFCTGQNILVDGGESINHNFIWKD